MDIPYVRGRVATQAHVALPEGTVEEEYARNGFSGRYAHLYRTEPPVGWTRIEGPLRPRLYDLTNLGGSGVDVEDTESKGDWLSARVPLLGNRDVRLHWAELNDAMRYSLRNADADELFFIHEGAGTLATDFGPLAYETGDYLLLPRGTAYRMAPSTRTRALVMEFFSEVRVPDRGMLGQHALFDPAVLKVPTPGDHGTARSFVNAQGEHELRVLRRGTVTRVFYPYDPLNTVGWKGTLSVWQLNVRDIRPVLSDRYHLPPSAHSTFIARDAVVCTFAPRPLENGDPRALKVPFYHSNIDFDEVLFYHRGQFFSRKGVREGMLTLHPQGIHHGPQPGAEERAAHSSHTEEIAVMLDTRNPLEIEPAAEALELPEYYRSWSR